MSADNPREGVIGGAAPRFGLLRVTDEVIVSNHSERTLKRYFWRWRSQSLYNPLGDDQNESLTWQELVSSYDDITINRWRRGTVGLAYSAALLLVALVLSGIAVGGTFGRVAAAAAGALAVLGVFAVVALLLFSPFANS